MAETFLLFKEPQLSSESVIEERKAVSEVFKKFKEKTPLVHCITNYVAMNISANVLLSSTIIKFGSFTAFNCL